MRRCSNQPYTRARGQGPWVACSLLTAHVLQKVNSGSNSRFQILVIYQILIAKDS